MKHLASSEFWAAYNELPNDARKLADKNFALLKNDPNHPSLRLKKIDRYFSARVVIKYRALSVPIDGGLLWFWIGTHADYDAMIK